MSIHADDPTARAAFGASWSTWTAGAIFSNDELAARALAELRQAGFEDWQIEIRRRGGRRERRAIVTITADGRHHEAAAILRRCGASRLALMGPNGLGLG